MSLDLLALGQLTADPVERTSAGGKRFATATMRVATEDDSILASVIAFGAVADELLAHRQGSTIAISGRAKLTHWTGRDGAEHHGLGITAEQVVSASSARRADARRRGSSARAHAA